MTERLTGKERMDAIKSRRKNVRPDVLPIWFEDMDYLIERVDELERKNYDLREDLAGRHSTVEELNEKIDELWKQNKRLREAIQEAMELNHDENFNYDVDKVLLKALESEKIDARFIDKN